MQKFEYNMEYIGKRVYINAIPNWLTMPIREGICFLKVPMTGKIIGGTLNSEKIAVEFDQPIWEPTLNSTDVYIMNKHYTTSCNGKGKKGHCAYFFPIHVQTFESNPSKTDTPPTNNLRLLLLKQ